MISPIFRNWELMLLIVSQPPWEKKADVPKVVYWDTVDPICHTEALQPAPLSGRQQGGPEEDDGKILLFSAHLPKGSTSGSDKVSKSTPGLLPHQWWRIKELGKKVKQKKTPGKDVFMITYRGKKNKDSKYTTGRCMHLRKFILRTCLFNRSYNSRIAKRES